MAIRIGPPKTPPAKPPRIKPPKPPTTLFEQLLPCEWRGIGFPLSSIRVSFQQDLAEHKYWGKDGANVEATGRGALQIEAVIPFLNGIVPGKNEKWGVLYPTTFREFVQAFVDRTTGVFKHPELGEITCKPQTLEFSHDAQRRDGVEVTAHWIETVENDATGELLQKDSPIQVADLAALDLDASEADLLALVPAADFPDETFESLMGKMTGVVDSTTSSVKMLLNKPNQMMYRVNKLADSVQRARNALTWPVVEQCETLKAAMHEIQAAVTKGTRKIERFTTVATTTMAGLLASIPTATADDLIALNPILVSRPVVAANTVIRYYAS